MKLPSTELSPSWQGLRDWLARATWSDALKDAGLFAFDVLEEHLGADWPAYSGTKYGLPPDLGYAGTHLFATSRLIDLGLRLDVLKATRGMAKVRRTLTQSPTAEQLLHAAIQLEIAALAADRNGTILLEPRREESRSPADVQVQIGNTTILAEVCAVLPDARSVQTSQRASRLQDQMLMTRARYGVAIAGSIQRELTDNDVERVSEWVEERARFAERGGLVPPLREPGIDIAVAKQGSPSASDSFSIAIAMEEPWSRLQRKLSEKAEQCSRSGATWLRIDVFKFLWQAGPLFGLSLTEKLRVTSNQIREWLDGFDYIEGVVLSDAAANVNPGTSDEMHRDTEGAIALHRGIDRLRPRESLVIPLHERSDAAATLWFEIYDSEPRWASKALEARGLRFPSELSRTA